MAVRWEAMTDDLHARVAAGLRGVQQRYTSGRRALVEALAGADCPLTTAELVRADRRLTQSTTYRNLAVLEQAGVVRRVVAGDEFSRFELAEELTGRHHHHLVCVSCGAVQDYDPPVRIERGLAEWAGAVANSTGFLADTHRLDLLGTCARCSA
jgi:Fe2+ or Zn2+ uptake regulation protein